MSDLERIKQAEALRLLEESAEEERVYELQRVLNEAADLRIENQRLRNAIGDVRGMQSDGATPEEMDQALSRALQGQPAHPSDAPMLIDALRCERESGSRLWAAIVDVLPPEQRKAVATAFLRRGGII